MDKVEDIRFKEDIFRKLVSSKWDDKLKDHLDKLKFSYEQYQSVKDKMTKIMMYCLQDSELCLDIVNGLNIWTSYLALSSVVGVSIIELFTSGQQVRCMSQLYRKATERGYVLVKRGKPGRGFSGGFVFKPRPGLYPIVFIDFASLYPSIMRAYNICYTTWVMPEYDDIVPDEDCNIIEFDQDESKFSTEESKAEEEEIEVEEKPVEDEDEEATGKKKKLVHYRYRFIKREIMVGLIPEIVEELVLQRAIVRKKQKEYPKGSTEWTNFEALQLALKVSANSFFGFLGVLHGYMPFIEGAMCITAKGREIITETNRRIEKKYKTKVVYGDTDSSAVKVPKGLEPKEYIKWGEKLIEDINGVDSKGNKTGEPWFPAPLTVALEKAGRIFILTPKRYAYQVIDADGNYSDSEGSIVFKGVGVVRRDFCPWAQNTFKTAIFKVITGASFMEVIKFLADKVFDLIDEKVPVQELATTKKMGAHYKSPSYPMRLFGDHLKEIGKPATAGERLEYVIIKNDEFKYQGQKMRLIETYQENKDVEPLDYLYYIEKVLCKQIAQIVETGYSKKIRKMEIPTYRPTNRHKPIEITNPIMIMVHMLKREKKPKRKIGDLIKVVDKTIKRFEKKKLKKKAAATCLTKRKIKIVK